MLVHQRVDVVFFWGRDLLPGIDIMALSLPLGEASELIAVC